MRLKDLKVGVDYAVGTEEHNARAMVLEVGVRSHVHTGERWDWNGHQSVRADFVRVRYPEEGGRPARETNEHRSRFLRTWAEQDPRLAAKKLTAQTRQAHEDRLKDLAARLTAAGYQADVVYIRLGYGREERLVPHLALKDLRAAEELLGILPEKEATS